MSGNPECIHEEELPDDGLVFWYKDGSISVLTTESYLILWPHLITPFVKTITREDSHRRLGETKFGDELIAEYNDDDDTLHFTAGPRTLELTQEQIYALREHLR